MPLIQTQDTNRADSCQTLLVAHKCSHLLDFGAHTHTHTYHLLYSTSDQTILCQILAQQPPLRKLFDSVWALYGVGGGVTSFSYGALNRVT